MASFSVKSTRYTLKKDLNKEDTFLTKPDHKKGRDRAQENIDLTTHQISINNRPVTIATTVETNPGTINE